MRKFGRRVLWTSLLPAVLSAPSALAQTCSFSGGGNFAVILSVNNTCGTQVSSTTAETLFKQLESTSGLQSLNSAYTPTSQASVDVLFNGALLTLAAVQGTSTVTLNIPALGYSKAFTGADRDASIQLLKDDLLKTDILGKIVNLQATSSATSPLLGIGGLIPNVVSSEFNQNFTDAATQIAAPPVQAGSMPSSVPNLIGFGLQFGSFSAKDIYGFKNKVEVVTLPLSYTFRNNVDPRRQLSLSIPITQVDVNGAKVYSLGSGLSYRLPLNDRWTVVPSARVSAVGSIDLATVSGVSSVGLTSVYLMDVGSYTLAVGNMASHNSTLKIKAGEYSFNPNISNTVLRNGLMLSQPVNMAGQRLSMEYSLVDTRYVSGTRPYVDQYQELGITIGTNKNAYSARSFLRAGLTYTTGKGTEGFTANVGYWF